MSTFSRNHLSQYATLLLLLTIITAAPPGASAQCLDYAQFMHVKTFNELVSNGLLRVVVSGSYAYVGDAGAGFMIFDVSNPSEPIVNGAVNTPGTVADIFISGTRAYVADGTGLQIIDISEPWLPQVLDGLTTPGTAEGVCVVGNYAYIADESDGLQIVDLADESGPRIVGTYDTPVAARGVTASGSIVYVADWNGGLIVIDASDPTSPVMLSTLSLGSLVFRLELSGDLIYAKHTFGMKIVDVSDPENPLLLGSWQGGVGGHSGLAVEGNRAYVCEYYSGFNVIDISDPTNPQTLSTIKTGIQHDLAVFGSQALVACDDGLYSIAMPSDDVVAPENELSLQDASALHIEGTRLFATDRYGDLSIIDISSPPHMSVLGVVQTPNMPLGVDVAGDYAFVADSEAGLQIFEIFDPSNPSYTSSVDTPGLAKCVDVSNGYAYVADQLSGLQIIDVTDPRSPWIAFTLDTPDSVSTVAVRGNYVYMGCSSSLFVVDVSDPGTPLIVDQSLFVGELWSIVLDGDYLYTVGAYGIYVINISTPDSPDFHGMIGTVGAPQRMAISGSYAYVTSYDRLQVVDVTEPWQPVLVGGADTGASIDVAVSNGYVYTAEMDAGIKVFPAQCSIVPAYLSSFAVQVERDAVHIDWQVAGGEAEFQLTGRNDEGQWDVPVMGIDAGVYTALDRSTHLWDAREITYSLLMNTGDGQWQEIAEKRIDLVSQDMTAQLRAAYPNPFNPQTTISFDLMRPAVVSLEIHDMAGHLVKSLISGEAMAPGRKDMVWNGRDEAGRLMPSGAYFYRLTAGDRHETKRMMLVR